MMGALVEVFVLVGLVVVLCMAFRDIGFDQGFKKGHAEACAEEENWWISAEKEIDEARQQIWREEPKKGRWV